MKVNFGEKDEKEVSKGTRPKGKREEKWVRKVPQSQKRGGDTGGREQQKELGSGISLLG